MTTFKEGDKVELLPGREQVYPRAVVASRGTVTRLRQDEDGFDQIYVVWDRTHWRYNGERDGWTFAEHFRPVEDAEILAAEDFDIISVPSVKQEEIVSRYLDTLMAACDLASESDAFFFISVKRDSKDQLYFEVMGASVDDDIADLSMAEIFSFVEQEIRRRGS